MRSYRVKHTRIVKETIISSVEASNELDAVTKAKAGLEVWNEEVIPGDIVEETDFVAELEWTDEAPLRRKTNNIIEEGEEDASRVDGF